MVGLAIQKPKVLTHKPSAGRSIQWIERVKFLAYTAQPITKEFTVLFKFSKHFRGIFSGLSVDFFKDGKSFQKICVDVN